MATNLLAPNGLSVARSVFGGAATFQANQYAIKNGYGTAIGKGDLVKLLGTPSQGFIGIATTSETAVLGVFAGVLPYYDTNLQGISHGLNGSYPTAASPPAGVNIGALVYVDPGITFIGQTQGTFAQSWVGQNINFLTGTNGAPNISGTSTLQLDSASIATTATLPFQIVGPAGVTGGPQDPANTNAWIEVRLNISSLLSSTGI